MTYVASALYLFLSAVVGYFALSAGEAMLLHSLPVLMGGGALLGFVLIAREEHWGWRVANAIVMALVAMMFHQGGFILHISYMVMTGADVAFWALMLSMHLAVVQLIQTRLSLLA